MSMAKYLEHKIRRFEEAAFVAEQAINRLLSHRIEDRCALEYRMNRLQRKVDRQRGRAA
ncbi:MAG: hypothetical protein VX822_02055 [Candidatus Neomarinimicrobiota bacterium]|nr:hypothetical protein [Candidatus Neomarinimicrobiota bacterium]